MWSRIYTDKSHKLAVIGIETYKKMGEKHTEKDRNIPWEEVVVRQRRVNGLTRGLVKALGIGDSWGERNAARK